MPRSIILSLCFGFWFLFVQLERGKRKRCSLLETCFRSQLARGKQKTKTENAVLVFCFCSPNWTDLKNEKKRKRRFGFLFSFAQFGTTSQFNRANKNKKPKLAGRVDAKRSSCTSAPAGAGPQPVYHYIFFVLATFAPNTAKHCNIQQMQLFVSKLSTPITIKKNRLGWHSRRQRDMGFLIRRLARHADGGHNAMM